MSEYSRKTRADRHLKRRKNKRNILFFSLLAFLFVIILFSLIIFGNKDNKESMANEEVEIEEPSSDDTAKSDGTEDEDINNEDFETEIVDHIEEVVIQQVDSTDENVLEAYTGNWQPIGTTQEGPHTTNYNSGSTDRIEIKNAVSLVTGIDPAQMIEHWVGNNGEQKVISTVENKQTNDLYQVYLTWIDEEGWQVTRVERIKEIIEQ